MKIKTKRLKQAVEAFFKQSTDGNADSMHQRTQNQPKKHLPKDDATEDENEFVRHWDDCGESDLQLKLKSVYLDLMKGEDDEK